MDFKYVEGIEWGCRLYWPVSEGGPVIGICVDDIRPRGLLKILEFL